MRVVQFLLFLLVIFNVSSFKISQNTLPSAFDYLSNIDPTILQSVRYHSTQNFVGQVIDGYYSSTIILTKLAATALANVQDQMNSFGYTLVVYDGYRPQKAVNNFIRWVQSPEDYKTKAKYYPLMDKTDLFAQGYLYEKSGHTRGSTMDLSYIPLGQSVHEVKEVPSILTNGSRVTYLDDGTVFTCTSFDFFGLPSHHDTTFVSQECLDRRNFLRQLMLKHGFKQLNEEWWHYTLVAQPFPDTYFDFDII